MAVKSLAYAPGIIIKSGREKEFFSELNKKRLSNELWDECKYLRSNINEHSIAELNKLMDKDK